MSRWIMFAILLLVNCPVTCMGKCACKSCIAEETDHCLMIHSFELLVMSQDYIVVSICYVHDIIFT